MTELDSADSLPSGFLSFSLVSQEIIAVLFAFYSYQQGAMGLATFYLALAALLLVGMGINSIFNFPQAARALLALVLVASFFYLLANSTDSSALLWCLTIIPVLVGNFGYRYSVLILGTVLALSLWLFYGGASNFCIDQAAVVAVISEVGVRLNISKEDTVLANRKRQEPANTCLIRCACTLQRALKANGGLDHILKADAHHTKVISIDVVLSSSR